MRSIILIIAVFVIGVFLYNHWSVDNVGTTSTDSPIAQRQQALDSLILVQAIKEADPDLYQEMQQIANRYSDATEIVESVASILGFKLTSRLQDTSNSEARYRWAKAYLQQLHNTRRNGECGHVLLPSKSDLDPTGYQRIFNDISEQKTRDAITYLVSHPTGKESKIDKDIVKTSYWKPLLRELHQRYGEDTDLIFRWDVADDVDRQCDMMIALFEKILAKPSIERDALLDYYFHNNVRLAVF